MAFKKIKSWFKELKRIVFKSNEKRTLSVVFYRITALFLVPIFIITPFSANMITFLASIVTFASAILFTYGDFWFNMIAVGLLYFSLSLDYVDGSIARYKKHVTVMQGRFLDDFFHEIPMQFLYFAIGLGVYINTNNISYLVLGAFASMFQLATVHTFQLRKNILLVFSKRKHEYTQAGMGILREKNAGFHRVFADTGIKQTIQGLFIAPIKYIKPILLVFVLLNSLNYFLILYSIFITLRFVIFLGYSFYSIKKIEQAEAKIK